MSKFVEVHDRYKKYFINVDNILSAYSTDKDGYNTRITLRDSMLVFSSKDIATSQRYLSILESYDEIKDLITQ